MDLYHRVMQDDILRYVAWAQLMSLWPEQSIYAYPKQPNPFPAFYVRMFTTSLCVSKTA
jgi:hypothetical protein